jgi:hypothetical protein
LEKGINAEAGRKPGVRFGANARRDLPTHRAARNGSDIQG